MLENEIPLLFVYIINYPGGKCGNPIVVSIIVLIARIAARESYLPANRACINRLNCQSVEPTGLNGVVLAKGSVLPASLFPLGYPINAALNFEFFVI